MTEKTTRISYSDESDEFLIREFSLRKDNKCFAELYSRYIHLAFGASLKFMKDHEKSKDAAMTVFEKLFKNPPSSEINSFKSWLHKMIQNECLSQLRVSSNRGVLFEKYEEEEKKSSNFMENAGLTRLINEGEAETEISRLRTAIQNLPNGQKECIQLFYLEEKSYKEIAKITKYGSNEVKSFLQNGKRNLKLVMTGMIVILILLNVFS